MKMKQKWDETEIDAMLALAKDNMPDLSDSAMEQMLGAAFAAQARIQRQNPPFVHSFLDELRDIFMKPLPLFTSGFAACCGAWFALYPVGFLPDMASVFSAQDGGTALYYALYEEIEIGEETP